MVSNIFKKLLSFNYIFVTSFLVLKLTLKLYIIYYINLFLKINSFKINEIANKNLFLILIFNR